MDFAVLMKKVGDNIRTARWLAGWTQQDVASCGISYRYYQELERGQRNPTLRTLTEIADILGVNVADLVDVPGARVSKPPLSARKAKQPRRGRRPRKSPRSRE